MRFIIPAPSVLGLQLLGHYVPKCVCVYWQGRMGEPFTRERGVVVKGRCFILVSYSPHNSRGNVGMSASQTGTHEKRAGEPLKAEDFSLLKLCTH